MRKHKCRRTSRSERRALARAARKTVAGESTIPFAAFTACPVQRLRGRVDISCRQAARSYFLAPPAASPLAAAAFLAVFSASALASLRERAGASQRAYTCGRGNRIRCWCEHGAQRPRVVTAASAAGRAGRTAPCAAAASARPSRFASASGCASTRERGRCHAAEGADRSSGGAACVRGGGTGARIGKPFRVASHLVPASHRGAAGGQVPDDTRPGCKRRPVR